MTNGVENIGRRDIAWSYLATIFMIGGGVILLPFILHKLPTETVGIWNIYQTITALVVLLDFGFQPNFSRTISYIFSGVHTLKKEGVDIVTINETIDYSLLRETIDAMRRFYRAMALAVFGLLAIGGSIYMYFILQKFTGNTTDIIVSWCIFITINCILLYTFYYDALMVGKGYIKRNQQITIIGQACYIGLAIGLMYAGCGLVAIVSAQLVSIIIRRILIYHTFYTKELKQHLQEAEPRDQSNTLQTLLPNSLKMGLTNLGGFFIYKAPLLIGSILMPLDIMAAYGISIQLVDILSRCGTVTYQSYIPKIAQYRATNDIQNLQHIYLYSIVSMVGIFIVGGICLVCLGNWALGLVHTQTLLLPVSMLIVYIIIRLLESNHVISAGFIIAKNEIPFYIPSLLTGLATVILIYAFYYGIKVDVWALILAPGLAQLAYQNWRWPSIVIKELFATKQA